MSKHAYDERRSRGESFDERRDGSQGARREKESEWPASEGVAGGQSCANIRPGPITTSHYFRTVSQLLLHSCSFLLPTMVFAMARDGPSPSATQAFIHTAFLPTSTPAQRTNSPARSREAATIKERDLEARYSTHYAPRAWHTDSSGFRSGPQALLTPREERPPSRAGGRSARPYSAGEVRESRRLAARHFLEGRKRDSTSGMQTRSSGLTDNELLAKYVDANALMSGDAAQVINRAQRVGAAKPNPWLIDRTHHPQDVATRAYRTSVKASPSNSGVHVRGSGATEDADGVFRLKQHLTPGTLQHARMARGLPPGYSGCIPLRIEHDASMSAFKVGGEQTPRAETPRGNWRGGRPIERRPAVAV